MKVKAVYIGQRISSKNRLAHFWLFGEKLMGWKKNVAPATVGETWTFEMKDERTITTERPERVGIEATPERVSQWVAEEAAQQQIDANRRADKTLAERRADFDVALEPLKRLLSSVHQYELRAALIQRITTELWRR